MKKELIGFIKPNKNPEDLFFWGNNAGFRVLKLDEREAILSERYEPYKKTKKIKITIEEI